MDLEEEEEEKLDQAHSWIICLAPTTMFRDRIC
jgi:hypothetical protein